METTKSSKKRGKCKDCGGLDVVERINSMHYSERRCCFVCRSASEPGAAMCDAGVTTAWMVRCVSLAYEREPPLYPHVTAVACANYLAFLSSRKSAPSQSHSCALLAEPVCKSILSPHVGALLVVVLVPVRVCQCRCH